MQTACIHNTYEEGKKGTARAPPLLQVGLTFLSPTLRPTRERDQVSGQKGLSWIPTVTNGTCVGKLSDPPEPRCPARL